MFDRGEMFADARWGACAHAKRWLENYTSGIERHGRNVDDPFALILIKITLPNIKEEFVLF